MELIENSNTCAAQFCYDLLPNRRQTARLITGFKVENCLVYQLHRIHLLLLPGAERPLVGSFGLLNDLFPLPSILDAGYPVSDLHLADVLFDVILPSVLGSSL